MSPRVLDKAEIDTRWQPEGQCRVWGGHRVGRIGLVGLAVFGTLLALPASAAHFRGLGTTTSYADPEVVRMNATGDRIVGSLAPQPPGGPLSDVAAIWNEKTHAFELVGPPTASYQETVATGHEVSNDGNIRRTIGWAERTSPPGFDMWLREENQPTGTVTTTIVTPYPSPTASMLGDDISRGGHILGRYIDGAIGSTFFYDPNSTIYTDLPDLLGTDMDADGTRVVGVGIASLPVTQAVLWDAASGSQQVLGPLPGGASAAAHGISASGRVVVGSSESANVATGSPPQEAFRWHPDLGIHALDPIPIGESRVSSALATSDANVVVGWYNVGFFGVPRAFIWTPETGRVDLKTFLTTTYELGAELSNWTLLSATAISADGMIIAGQGVSPSGDAEDWVVDLTDEDKAVLKFRPVNPPLDWELYLECGDDPIGDLFFGIIPPNTFSFDGLFDFADCTNSTNVLDLPARTCLGSEGIGPNVSETSYVILPTDVDGEPVETVRQSTFYLGLEGGGGPGLNTLCQPGDDETYLGYFQIDVAEGNSELTVSALSSVMATDDLGDEIPAEKIRLVRERLPGGVNVHIRRALDDVDGSKWMTSIEAPDAYAKFSFGIILPPAVVQDVSFGGCNERFVGLGDAERRRGCADGALLGHDIDYTAVRTMGPGLALAAFGMRTDTLYVYVEGGLSGTRVFAQMNTPNNRSRLGLFSFDEPVDPLTGVAPTHGPGFVPTVTFDGIENFPAAWADIDAWIDLGGIDQTFKILFSSGPYGKAKDPDWDGDMFEDADDKCPYVPSPGNGDKGTLEQTSQPLVSPTTPDGVGDECQCGDAQDIFGVVVELDIKLLREVLANPELAPMIPPAAKKKCNSVGPLLHTIDPSTQLPKDCDLNDVYVLLKAQAGLPPLIPMPGEFPSCPDVMTQ